MRRFFHFIQYNNIVPIALFVIFGSSSLALAFDEDVQKAVYSVEEEVRSVDNTYLIDVDLDAFDFDLKILEVREDDEKYYVKYSYTMISLIDYVWQEEVITETLDVSKKSMVGKDLGLFVGRQVGELVASKLAYLQKVQEIETKNGASVKKVAKLYKGLVGKMFDPTEEEFPGYKPVVKEKPLATTQAAQLSEPFVSQIALPHVPSESDIQKMVDAAYLAMLMGDESAATSTATTSEIGEGEDDDTTDAGNNEGTDDTSTTTDDGIDDPVDETTSTSTDEGGDTPEPIPEPEPESESEPVEEEQPEPIPEPEPEPVQESTPPESPAV